MRRIKAQYFLSYAVMGSLLPFLSVFLEHHGLTYAQIGQVAAAASVSVLLTPVVVTFLADSWADGRVLLASGLGLSASALGGLYFVDGYGPITCMFVLYSLAFAPTIALKDGLNFSAQGKQSAQGLPAVPYHRVRVWGTIGFMIPSVFLFVLLRYGYGIEMILLCAIGFCVLGLANALLLPASKIRPRMSPAPDPAGAGVDQGQETQWPTIAAARAMTERHVLIFCAAMFLLHMSAAAYYAFYPLYLTQEVGLPERWVGLAANVGVGIEIFYVLGFGRLLNRLGLKRLLLLSAAAMAMRFAWLGASDTVAVAVGTQLVHGLMVLAVHVTPPIFFNRQAAPHYRHSMQGLYTMCVFGSARITGNLLAGYVAQWGIAWTFAGASGLCVVAAIMLWAAFHDHHPRQ